MDSLEKQFRKGQYHDLIATLTNKIRQDEIDLLSTSQIEHLFTLYLRSLYLSSSLSKTTTTTSLLLPSEIEFDSDCDVLMQRMNVKSVSFLSADLVLHR